jgi:hypothetical protein
MYAYTTNRGRKWTKGEVLANICSFDQVSSATANAVTFRTNDFPWAANDRKNFYVFYSDRDWNGEGNCATGRPRIVMKHATSVADLVSSPVRAIDDSLDAAGGFQFMPAAIGDIFGNVQVAWYDTRREGITGPPSVVADHFDGVNIVHRRLDVYTARVISNATGDHVTISPATRVTQFPIVGVVEGETSTDPGTVVSTFEHGASFANQKLYASGTLPHIGDYIAVAAQQYYVDEDGKTVGNSSAFTEALPDQADFFVAWTSNRDVRGTIFDQTTLENTVLYSPPVNNPAMVENLEAPQGPLPDGAESQMVAGLHAPPDALPEANADTRSTEGVEDPFDPNPPVCIEQEEPQDRTRNANIYGSRLRGQVRLTAPTPTKPLTNLQRAFPVALTNSNDESQSYRLRITDEPAGAPTYGRASFRQLPAVPPFDLLPLPDIEEDLTVPPKSTFARTVFMVSIDEDASTGVQAFDQACAAGNPEYYFPLPAGCPVLASITLGGEGSSVCDGIPDCSEGTLQQPNYQSTACSEDPDCTTDDVLQAELHNPELINPELINPELINPELINPELINPELINPELINPELINPELINLGFANPELINPELINPELINPELINPELINPELINPELINTSIEDDLTWTDYTFAIRNNGNVTTALDADVTVSGPAAGEVDSQLIAWTLYITPTSRDCNYLPQVERRVLATVNNPDGDLEVATIGSPFEGEISAIAAPGQTIFFTQRVIGTADDLANIVVGGATFASQAANCSVPDNPNEDDPYFCKLALASDRELILLDTQPPTWGDLINGATIPDPPIEADREGGACVDLVGDGIVTAEDDSGFAVVTCTDSLGADICTVSDPEQGQSIPVNTTGNPEDAALVTCTAVDGSGNEATINLLIDVQDTVGPDLTVPTETIHVDHDDEFGAIVYYSAEVSVTDTVDPSPDLVCDPASGTLFPTGTTTVECTATDSSGNATMASFDVEVGYLSGFGIDVAKTTMRAGSSNQFTWGWENSTGPADSSGDTQLLVIREWNELDDACTGPIVLIPSTDPGQSGMRFDSLLKEWAFNFQADDEFQEPLPKDSYCGEVTSDTTGQSLTTPEIRVK